MRDEVQVSMAAIAAKTQGYVNAISLVGINCKPGLRLSDWFSKGCSINSINWLTNFIFKGCWILISTDPVTYLVAQPLAC